MVLYVISQHYVISGMANTTLVHIWEHHNKLSSCCSPTNHYLIWEQNNIKRAIWHLQSSPKLQFCWNGRLELLYHRTYHIAIEICNGLWDLCYKNVSPSTLLLKRITINLISFLNRLDTLSIHWTICRSGVLNMFPTLQAWMDVKFQLRKIINMILINIDHRTRNKQQVKINDQALPIKEDSAKIGNSYSMSQKFVAFLAAAGRRRYVPESVYVCRRRLPALCSPLSMARHLCELKGTKGVTYRYREVRPLCYRIDPTV